MISLSLRLLSSSPLRVPSSLAASGFTGMIFPSGNNVTKRETKIRLSYLARASTGGWG